VVVDEIQQFIACSSLGFIFDSGPVTPAIGRSNDRFIGFTLLFLLRVLKIIEVFEEEQPGKLRKAVGVTGESSILA
jgi:hypothetical protein